jgi:hypothetical protein
MGLKTAGVLTGVKVPFVVCNGTNADLCSCVTDIPQRNGRRKNGKERYSYQITVCVPSLRDGFADELEIFVTAVFTRISRPAARISATGPD